MQTPLCKALFNKVIEPIETLRLNRTWGANKLWENWRNGPGFLVVKQDIFEMFLFCNMRQTNDSHRSLLKLNSCSRGLSNIGLNI